MSESEVEKPTRLNPKDVVEQASKLISGFARLNEGYPESFLVGPNEYFALIQYQRTQKHLIVDTSLGRPVRLFGLPIKYKVSPGLDLEVSDQVGFRMAVRGISLPK